MRERSRTYVNPRLPKSHCNLIFNKEITRWDEAIPLGNGDTGCLIWGKSTALRLSLDRGDIWDKTPSPHISADDFTYESLVALAKEGKTDEIRARFDSPYYHTVPTKLPAGKIIINLGESETITSSLNLATAEAKVEIKVKDNKFDGSVFLWSFLHATKQCGFIKINLSMVNFSLELVNPEFGVIDDTSSGQSLDVVDSVNTASLKKLLYPAPIIQNYVSEKKDIYEKSFVQIIDSNFSYGIFLKIFSDNYGKSEIVYTVASSNDGDDWQEQAKNRVSELLTIGYDTNFEEHSAWWEDYWGKSGVSIPDKLFDRNWYLTNYLLASCSRKGCYPMPLQGVWTADDGSLPPWKGDYHHDLNTQMSYYSYLKANHIEEGENFVDFLWDLVPKAREFARTFFRSKGLCLPSVMAINGTALGGWPMYTLVPTNQLWLCQVFERYYHYTGDFDFLKDKAYIYFSESMECILGVLEVDEGGLYRLPASSSPEIHDDSAGAWLTPNSNYDLALMRYAATQLVKFSRILNNDKESFWQEVLDKLPQLSVNENNVLMLSPDESLQESHRHHAHAMAIHPLRLIDCTKELDKKIIDATVHNLEVLGTGLWCGYSFTWMSEFYAIQGNGNGAAYQLRVFWENCCSQNGFHLNGDYKNRGTSQFHYRPFTLEGNFCAADALQEMLLQTEDDTINLFPAIPDEWLDNLVSFVNFRAKNGLLVSSTLRSGKITSLVLKPEQDIEVKVKYSHKLGKISLVCDCKITLIESNLVLSLFKGREVKLI